MRSLRVIICACTVRFVSRLWCSWPQHFYPLIYEALTFFFFTLLTVQFCPIYRHWHSTVLKFYNHLDIRGYCFSGRGLCRSLLAMARRVNILQVHQNFLTKAAIVWVFVHLHSLHIYLFGVLRSTLYRSYNDG